MKRIGGIIWDLDGTILNTLEDIAASGNVALASIGQPGFPPERWRGWVGHGLPVLLTKATDGRVPELIDRMVATFRAHYVEHYADHTMPYPGVGEALDAASKAGIPMSILSNKPQRFTAGLVERLLGQWRFVQVVGLQEPATLKPHPGAALRLADEMGVDPSRLFLVGDSPIDVETARNAGMVSVAASWGFRDRDELVASEPDHLVDRPSELARLWGL